MASQDPCKAFDELQNAKLQLAELENTYAHSKRQLSQAIEHFERHYNQLIRQNCNNPT